MVFSAFQCTSFEADGKLVSFQRVDLSTKCSEDGSMTTERRFIIAYASLMVVVFAIGIPLVIYLIMWRKRRAIEGRESRIGGPELDNLSWLFRLYGREHWHYATIDMCRRILLSSAPLALENTELVFLLVFVVSVGSVTTVREVGP